MSNTWKAQQAGNYSAAPTWAKLLPSPAYSYAVTVITLNTIHVTDTTGTAVTNFPDGTQFLLHDPNGQGDVPVTVSGTPVNLASVTTITVTQSLAAEASPSGARVYIDGTPAAGDTYNLNGVDIVQDVNPADNLTLVDSAGGGSLAISGAIVMADFNTAFTSGGSGSSINVTGSLTVTGTWLDASTNTSSALNSSGTVTISGLVDFYNASAGALPYNNFISGTGGTTTIAAGGELKTGPGGYNDAVGSVFTINGTFDYSHTSVAFGPNVTPTGNGTIILADTIGSGFKGIIEDANGVPFYSVGGRIQSIGPWPVTATSVGPFPITPTSLGPYPVV